IIRDGTLVPLAISLISGTKIISAAGKTPYSQVISAPNVAITVGILAGGGSILAAQTLLDGATLTVGTMTNQPDVPRNLSFVSNQASVGDGTFGAAGKWVTVVGTNAMNEAVTESLALNATTPVT